MIENGACLRDMKDEARQDGDEEAIGEVGREIEKKIHESEKVVDGYGQGREIEARMIEKDRMMRKDRNQESV